MKYFTFILLFLLLVAISSVNCQVNPLSTSSLLIELYDDSKKLGIATGFIIEWENKHYLITNWHVVTGKNPRTGEIKMPTGNIPSYIQIWHYYKRFGRWQKFQEELYYNNEPRWLEHPQGRNVDVIALPIEKKDEDIIFYPLDLSLADTDMLPEIAMAVSIIGFPNGMTGGANLPIWKTGYIASEPELDYDGEPCFLIDATTKGGMSGSPVIVSLFSGYRNKSKGSWIIGQRTLFLGVYSGRKLRKSEEWPLEEIGVVWKARVINEILENK
ncbi:MAG: trypsin-like peptidase domain-containing protein [FCB group bacterium]|nr:trypsin-like peptidase domain-containing protein [FCB group bacterium]